MVDNFELIKSHLAFENDGDCYYLQLLRRQSDDPMVDGKPDPAYHGNMHSRSLKDYFIRSVEELDERRHEITSLCDMFNVRAYIRMNKRNYRGLSMQILKHITDQLVSGQTFSSPFHLVSSAAGLANSAGKEKTWIVDLDAEYMPFKDDIETMCDRCESGFPIADGFYSNVLYSVPTKHGSHLVVRPFNLKQFDSLWCEMFTGLKKPDIHKDNPTILYCP